MKPLLNLALLLAFLVPQLAAQAAPQAPAQGGGKSTKDDNCGMIYGKAHSFTFCAPKGWLLDNSIGNQEGIYAVFYPQGSSWDEANQSGSIMYINTFGKPDDQYTIAKAMAFDAADTKKQSPSSVAKQGDPIKLGDLSVPVQVFSPGGFNRFEASAYIDSPKVIIMFVISSKTEEAFTRDYPAFIKLVQSYYFLSSNVTIQQK